MKIRCGTKDNLPVAAAAGEPLLTTDTQEMYIGTGTGVKKVSDLITSEDEPGPLERGKLWLTPSTGLIHAYDVGSAGWRTVENKASTDFGTF